MSLINCPECGEKISNQAPACPHCGYILQSNISDQDNSNCIHATPTELRGIMQDKPAAVICFILSIILISMSIFTFLLFSMLWGIIFFLTGIFTTRLCVFYYEKKNFVDCPYCGTTGKLPISKHIYKCKACHNNSVKKDGFLYPMS